MFKRVASLLAILALTLAVTVKGIGLALSYCVLFPLFSISALIFPEFFPLLIWGLFMLAIAASYLVYAAMHPSVETGILGACFLFFMAASLLYRRHWQRVLVREKGGAQRALQELEQLKQKHHSRLESLHHLEKQVVGLLGLFEIARDFNDSLSFEAIQDILQKRVVPELPFRRLRLFLFEPNQDIASGRLVIAASREESYHPPNDSEFTEEEKRHIQSIQQSKRLVQTNGTLIFPLLADGEMAAAMLVEGVQSDDHAKFEVLSAYMALQVRRIMLYQTVKELSIRDGLTGVFVRRHFLERFDEELKRSLKYNLPLSVLMLDIDHFKRYNDDYGHLPGDATLKQVARLLCENLRKVDMVARHGGEEFVVLIPETRKKGAHEVAERIRSNIARHQFKVFNDQTKVTVSIGISLFPEDLPPSMTPGDSSQMGVELIQGADKALYRAKEEGRNQVVFYQDL